jgi:hypothetical protein
MVKTVAVLFVFRVGSIEMKANRQPTEIEQTVSDSAISCVSGHLKVETRSRSVV